jgi:hypothetical protein
MPTKMPSEPIKSVPALADAGFDGDLDRRVADNGLLVGFRLLFEQFEAGHGDDAGRDGPWPISACCAFTAISTSEPEAKIVTLASLAETRS